MDNLSSNVKTSKQFKKDVKGLKSTRRYSLDKLKDMINLIVAGKQIPEKHNLHRMKERKNLWNCHLQGDWVLLYEKDPVTNEVYLVRTGTHSDLFR